MSIPEAELDVLTALTRLGRATARELREALGEVRPMAHGSVLTLLGRLEAKKLVTREKGDSGKAFVYKPTSSGQDANRSAVRKLLERVFAGSRSSMVATLLADSPPSAAEIEEMQLLLDNLRKKKERRRR
jgi:BlaI family penicillinase repressor